MKTKKKYFRLILKPGIQKMEPGSNKEKCYRDAPGCEEDASQLVHTIFEYTKVHPCGVEERRVTNLHVYTCDNPECIARAFDKADAMILSKQKPPEE